MRTHSGVNGAWEAARLRAIADARRGGESESSICVVTAGVAPAADNVMLSRGLTTQMAELVNMAVVPHIEHWSFAQTCAAYSALIKVGGLHSRFVGQNIFDYARRSAPIMNM
eukprot:897008-Pyramimonas_sp.AAC.1